MVAVLDPARLVKKVTWVSNLKVVAIQVST
jgi:hypothetical protein